MGKASPVNTLRSFLLRLGGTSRDLVDEQLLEQFAHERSDAAFAALMQRHGPLVWAACRRVLGDSADAEDAWQATFLVLARKAGALDPGRALASWLYTVAHNAAVDVKIRARRRQQHEQAAASPDQAGTGAAASLDVKELIDQELSGLPEKYRAPLVLCYLQGKTNEEAARELGWPPGSMSWRLERGRELLRQKLVRRGVASAVALAALQAEPVPAAPPADLARATGAAARAFADDTLPSSTSSARCAEGVLQNMSTNNSRLIVLTALMCGLLIAGGGLFAAGLIGPRGAADEQTLEPAQDARAKPAPRWQFQPPRVLEGFVLKRPRGFLAPPPQDIEYVQIGPAGCCWLNGRPILGVCRLKHYDLWTQVDSGKWKKLRTLDNLQFAAAPVALKDAVGIFSLIGTESQGYQKGMQFLRVPTGEGAVLTREIFPAPNKGRLSFVGVSVWQDRLDAFVLHQKSIGALKDLFLLRSTDQGATWSKPVRLETGLLDEDECLPILRWSATGFGRFVLQRDGCRFLFTTDDGKNWGHSDITFKDDDDRDALRVPLAATLMGTEVGLLYRATYPKSEKRAGTFYFTRSRDRRSWSKGIKVAPQPAATVGFAFAGLAAAGERLLCSFIYTEGIWEDENVHGLLYSSADGGQSWQPVPQDRYYQGKPLFSTVTADPRGDRLLSATILMMGTRLEKTRYVVVQDLSTRPSAGELTAAQRQQVKGLIARLAADDFETREAATRQLVEFGAAARPELQSALAAATDPETTKRLKHILDTLFPLPLRRD